MEGKWIKFQEIPTKGITKRFAVVNKESVFTIGYIQWYVAFRQYSFFPTANTVYEKTCLSDITKFIEKLMLDRKIEKQNKEVNGNN